jgi:VanZ family protein
MSMPSSPPSPRATRVLRRTLWTLTLTYAAFHFVMTHLPAKGLRGIGVNDKALHFASYGFMASCLYLSLWASVVRPLKAAGIVLLAAVTYGALDELLQPLVGRSQEWGDWIADVAGATVAVAGMTIIRATTSALRPRLSQLAPGDPPGVSSEQPVASPPLRSDATGG